MPIWINKMWGKNTLYTISSKIQSENRRNRRQIGTPNADIILSNL